MKKLSLTPIGIFLLIFLIQVKAIGGIDPVKLQSVEEMCKAVKNSELKRLELRQLAVRGKINPDLLNEFNKIQQIEWFNQTELEIFEQNFYGVKAKEYMLYLKKNKNSERLSFNSTENLNDGSYDLKLEEDNSVGGSQFGQSVANAGDVNNDGFDDVIIGASIDGNGLRNRVYIFFGGQNFDQTPDVIITWEGGVSNSYITVSSAGDVNNDGFDDVIAVRTRNSDEIGQADIFFGGTNMDNVADLTITSQILNFGCSVSTAGDVNNDGFDDIVIGAKGSSGKGNAYIYFGGASMDDIADVSLSGNSYGDKFGHSVANAGDVNNDGYDDVIVGAIYNTNNTGSAYIFYGGTNMDNIADVTLQGEGINNYFGWSVSSAGDVNNDGYSDVIVGAYKYTNNTGRAYLYYGGPNMNNVIDVTMTGSGTSNEFGRSVSSIGDVNNDGYDDIIVGAVGYSNIYLGGLSMDNTPDISMTGDISFGCSVSGGGDINNDGFSDIIIGASGYYLNYKGNAYVFYGGGELSDIPSVTLMGEPTNNYFGWSVSTAGDVNNDGYDDVVVGAKSYANYTGRVYVYYGGPEMDNIADVTMTGSGTYNEFGSSVSSAGDVNNDGYDDIIVGAITEGKAYIYFGGANMDNIPDITLTSGESNDYFGASVSTAGDVNNDGYDDVIIGAYFHSDRTGRAYIFYGSENMDNVVDVVMTGEGTYHYFGRSVSTAGDVNNDGYDDVIIGANQYSINTSLIGRAYIYYGSASMDNTADVIMEGEGNSNQFGCSVSTAGDVNNDGYDDVIIGAMGYLNNTGRAYIYYGATNMDVTADLTITGETVANNLGMSVSSAGDINKDGYDDVIIGGGDFNNDAGYVCLYYGGTNMDNKSDRTFTGETNGDFFGYSISKAGNIKGDGNSYLVIGAFNHSANGASYIYGPAEPIIINQPNNLTGLCSGINISYSIVAEYADNFQWQLSVDNGNTFNDLSNTGVYSNVTTATLNITALTIDMNNYQFRCVVSNEFSSINSEPALLRINPVPNVNNLPELTGECLVTAPTSPTATINCTDVIEGTTTTSFPIVEQGATVITWTYDDGNGNISTQTQNVIIEDVSEPIPNIEILPDLSGECKVLAPNSPTATDNCTGIITGMTTTSFPITEQGTTVITWTYDDGNGNISTQTQNVIIEDVSEPIPDIEILPDLSGECEVLAPNPPTATDNCTGTITGITTASFPITEQGTTVITWTYDDSNGNISTQTQNVIIEDMTYPTIECNESQTFNLDVNEDYYEVSGSELDPTISDNCNVANLSNDFNNLESLEGAQLPIGTTTILWMLYDNAGNSSACSIDVTVNANITGVEQLKDVGISIYPNPTNGVVKIEFLNSTASNVKVVNLSGKQLLEKKNLQSVEMIDLSQFRDGIYLFIFETGKKDYSVRIVKK